MNCRPPCPMARETTSASSQGDRSTGYIRRACAIPGNVEGISDLRMSDRPQDDMACAEWLRVGVIRKVDFKCPHHDTIDWSNLEMPLSRGEIERTSVGAC